MPRKMYARPEGIGGVLWAERWKAREIMIMSEVVVVIILGQLRKMHALRLDVPCGALYRSSLTNVPNKNGAGLPPLHLCPTLRWMIPGTLVYFVLFSNGPEYVSPVFDTNPYCQELLCVNIIQGRRGGYGSKGDATC